MRKMRKMFGGLTVLAIAALLALALGTQGDVAAASLTSRIQVNVLGTLTDATTLTDNQAVLDGLLASEEQWRRDLGDEAEAGVFLGRADHWRRISETWPDPNLDDPELGTELAMRLLDYIEALEPLRP